MLLSYDGNGVSKTKVYEESLKTLREKYDCNVSELRDKHGFTINQLLIENRYVYATTSGKWKVKGKGTWYNSKSLEHFMENYVLSKDRDFNLYIAAGILNGKHGIPRTKIRKLLGVSDQSVQKHAMNYLAGGYETKENHPQVQKIVLEILNKVVSTLTKNQ